jgi:hypothetical protein
MNNSSSISPRRRRPSAALIVSIVALVVALGGTSYAALALPKNSVGSTQIRSNAVSSPKVKDGSLLAKDFKKGELPQGKQGVQGTQGKQGIQGVAGTARAHATVQANGLVTPEFLGSHPGFTKVERSPANFPGIYCLTPAAGIPSVNSDAVVSADGRGSETMGTFVAAFRSIGTVGNDPACPTGTIEVETDRLLAGDANALANSNAIDFSIIVP